MQREIKLMGSYIDTGEFVYGFLISGLVKEPEYEVIFDDTTRTYYKVKAETVGQFTGLYDKTKWEDLTEEERAKWVQIDGNFPSEWKGQEIYEGDLFHCNPEGHEGRIYQVCYSEGATKFFLKRIGNACVQARVFQTVSDMSCYEKIGDIWTNPELLK
jgi:hypothetical protein